MSDLDPIPLRAGDESVQLTLNHYVADNQVDGEGPPKPVLLLHGASANHETFITPNGGLAKWLASQNFDPWLLDWRASSLVVDGGNNKGLLSQKGVYNFNAAAEFDIGPAIKEIRYRQGIKSPIAAVGYCVGGGILAEAVALGHVSPADVDCVVLMTLGLFYETPIDGRLKSAERILERLEGSKLGNGSPFLSVDPRVRTETPTNTLDLEKPWPEDLDAMYRDWPTRLKSHTGEQRNAVQEMCNRLSFMYGMPYHHANLVDEIHGTDSIPANLPKQFGAIPLHMYIHGARNIRQGHATFYDREHATLYDRKQENEKFLSDEARSRFALLQKVTLITGELNRLWHRNSIDLMHEWLCRGSGSDKYQKHVLSSYGHQDLLWGRKASKDVYPKIAEGLNA